jgi:hypothetical protein
MSCIWPGASEEAEIGQRHDDAQTNPLVPKVNQSKLVEHEASVRSWRPSGGATWMKWRTEIAGFSMRHGRGRPWMPPP